MSTSAYQAGIESNAVEISVAPETTWGVVPATIFQAIRITQESLAKKKQRTRPSEVKTTAEASAAVTQSEGADGGINTALSYGNADPLWGPLLNSDWAGLSDEIAGDTGDIAFAASGNTVSSTTSGKFADIEVGQWVRIAGTTSNNGFGRVATKADNTHFTLSGITLVDETPSGSAAKIKSSGYMSNSNAFTSLWVQKKLSSALYLNYPGVMLTGFDLSAQQGNYATLNVTALCKDEVKATSDGSTGGVIAAPTNRVYDTVGQFQQLQLDGAVIAAVCKGVQITMTKQGASADYGVGSASAQGMRMGEFTIDSGKATFYFKSFTLYDMFAAESQHTFSHRLTDAAGNTLIFTLNKVVLVNPTIVAGGPNQPVMADFTLQADPDAALGTFQVDRISA